MNKNKSITTNLVSFTLIINNEEVTDHYKILQITISKQVNRIPTATLVLSDGDLSKENFAASNANDFTPGNRIEIKAGYQSLEETIFKGMIVKQKIEAMHNKASVLEIECKDEAIKLTTGRKNTLFEEGITDSAAIEKILSNYSLVSVVESTSVKQEKLIQFYATDWDFMLSRIEANGQLVIVDDGKVSVNKPKTNQKPVFSLTYGLDIYEFEASLNASNQYQAVTSSSWDYNSQKVITADGSDDTFQEGDLSEKELANVMGLDHLNLQHAGSISKEELSAWANAQFTLKSDLAKIRGRVRFQGNATIKPDTIIELKGVGDRFNGNAYVSGIRHQIRNGNWITDAEFGLSPEWFTSAYKINDTRASGLLPAISGLQIAKVTQIYNDPLGEDRIQINIPIMNGDSNLQKGLWARIATLDAGSNRGTFFRPETDDEVIVGFLNDDPRDAIVLGMLNSSPKPAPLEATEENDKKGIISREQLKLMFDEKLKSVSISTPNGNLLTVSDDAGGLLIGDEHGNNITLDASGILLNSTQDIALKAQGDVRIEGKNVAVSANIKLTASGKTQAELSASGSTVIKGTLVKIN